MKLTGKEAREIVNEDSFKWEKVRSKIVDTSRWSIIYEDIHKHIESSKFYKFNYRRGATESQEENPYEYEEEVIPIEVTQIKVIRKEWVPVKEGE